MIAKVSNEFKWFDQRYFLTRDRADIDIYITGHGEEGGLLSSESFDKNCEFTTIFASILQAAQEQTERVYNTDCKQPEIEWYVRVMIDTCKSGSAIDELKRWASTMGDLNELEIDGKWFRQGQLAAFRG